MLPSGDGISVRPVTKVEALAPTAPIGDTRGDFHQRALQKILGQQIQGEVMSRLTDGSFMVKVGETAARMMLPQGSRIGDKMPMTLVSAEPRPTFVLGNDASQAAIVALSRGTQDDVETHTASNIPQDEAPPTQNKSADTAPPSTGKMQEQVGNAMQNGSAMMGSTNRLAQKFAQIGAMYRPEYEVPMSNVEDTPATIDKDGALITTLDTRPQQHTAGQSNASFSSAGKLINQLLQAAQRDGATGASQGKEAIVEQPGNPPQQMADALQNTINKSGLFSSMLLLFQRAGLVEICF